MRSIVKATKVLTHKDLEDLRNNIVQARSQKIQCIVIPSGTCSQARGSTDIIEAFQQAIQRHSLQDKVLLRTTGCGGFCQSEPNIVIYPEEIYYQKLSSEDAEDVILRTILEGKIIDRLLFADPVTGKKFAYLKEIPFFQKQRRLLLADNLRTDPTSIDDYLAIDGYSALSKALKGKTPDMVVSEIKQSGLRGRGGAGFSTGQKWEICKKATGDVKYVICNADEGDPGAYMDRSLLEGNPHNVIEGVIIGGYAIGAGEGIIYVRDEYPLAVKHCKLAIEKAREYGFLGKNILDSGFSFDITISMGAGAFVCGEETALIASIEGRRGTPSQRPPFPAQRGLWNKPTNINNVETWANVPLIIKNGADWYSSIGTEKSKGTKIFSLVGKINNTGLVEVPLGTTLREIIYDIGGGIPDDKVFKAVQTGGPSGGCIPSALLDLPIDYEGLKQAGCIMGSGGMIVMDEDTCMIDIARYYTSFLNDESCGKCFSCRKGTQRMLDVLTDISKGKGRDGDIALLEELAQVIKDASLCGLGQTAPNPVLSTIRYFQDEYEAHIKDKRCLAGVCKDLISFYVHPEKCQACLICLANCPTGAITGSKGYVHIINQDKCIKCGACLDVCPTRFSAVVMFSGEKVPVAVAEGTKVRRKKEPDVNT
jgi:NADH-quinone oxidoreductase subunit F